MEFASAIKALAEEGVQYIVIGGLAGVFHGSAAVTLDLDVCYDRTAENLRRLARALAPYHPRPRGFAPDLPFVWDEVTLRNGGAFTLTTDIGDIDLLAEVPGLGTYSDMLDKSLVVRAFDCEVRTLSLSALIVSKRATGREKDIRGLPELEGLLEAGET